MFFKKTTIQCAWCKNDMEVEETFFKEVSDLCTKVGIKVRVALGDVGSILLAIHDES